MNELSEKIGLDFFSTIMVIIMKNYDDNDDEILLKKNQLIMLCIQIILVKKNLQRLNILSLKCQISTITTTTKCLPKWNMRNKK